MDPKAPMRKLKKIVLSIRSEGLSSYFCRLYNLGQYRFYFRKAVQFYKLRRDTAQLYGHGLKLSERKAGISEELILYGVHEPLATKLYIQLLRPGDVIFDVGCNIGYYLLVADYALKGNCHIYAFEPDPELAELAAMNSRMLNSSIRVEQVAICDRNGKASFFASKVSNWGTLLFHPELKLVTKNIEVLTTNIDDYAIKNSVIPTVIRMDIEGGEASAIAGAKKTLQHVRLLFIELHCAFLTNGQIKRILETLGISGFVNCIWFNRYYDWPWSRPKPYTTGSIDEFRSFVLNRSYPAVTLFACKEAG